jgi:hypothetical protein
MNSALAIAMGRNLDAGGRSGLAGGSAHVFASEIFDTNPRLSMTSIHDKDNALQPVQTDEMTYRMSETRGQINYPA